MSEHQNWRVEGYSAKRDGWEDTGARYMSCTWEDACTRLSKIRRYPESTRWEKFRVGLYSAQK